MVYPEWQRILKQRRRSSIAFQALSVARSFEKEKALRGDSALQKKSSLHSQRSGAIAKVRGPQHFVESENRFGFLCHPLCHPGA